MGVIYLLYDHRHGDYQNMFSAHKTINGAQRKAIEREAKEKPIIWLKGAGMRNWWADTQQNAIVELQIED